MSKYYQIFINSFSDYWNYLVFEIQHPSWTNYFYWLLLVSIMVWAMEILFPWRKGQSIFRKDFWLDGFYMFFNFFIFNLIAFVALSNTVESIFMDVTGFKFQLIDLATLPSFIQLLLFFVITDFVQWCTHILLHKIPFLWQFHKVHHSVKQMGFAAHLRYHWMETVVYKSIMYLPVALIGGFKIEHVFVVHFVAILIGHLNHANIHLTYGPLKYILNNPVMHLWHHAKHLPKNRRMGANFGISLSVWDYIFKTNYLPKEDGEIELGFAGEKEFPTNFIKQEVFPFIK